MEVSVTDLGRVCNLIIPTHNRPIFLKRILAYYQKVGGTCPITVADSSSREEKLRNKKIVASFPDLDILYLDEYPSDIHPYTKIAHAVNHISQEYCVLCADDDFITPRGLEQSVDYLQKNPDFTVAQGYYFSFYIKKSFIGGNRFCWTQLKPFNSITYDDSAKRFFGHFSDYPSTFHAVHRTELFKMIFDETIRFTDDYLFGELLLSALALIYGKLKTLDVLYGCRQNPPEFASRRTEALHDFVKDGSYDLKYSRFQECLAMHLSKKSSLGSEEAKKAVDNAMIAYLHKDTSTTARHQLKNKVSELLNSMKLPSSLDHELRVTYRRLFLQRPKNSFLSLEDTTSPDYKDFDEIRSHVLSYAMNKR